MNEESRKRIERLEKRVELLTAEIQRQRGEFADTFEKLVDIINTHNEHLTKLTGEDIESNFLN